MLNIATIALIGLIADGRILIGIKPFNRDGLGRAQAPSDPGPGGNAAAGTLRGDAEI